MGYLYVIKAGNFCKVGITERSAYGRMKLVQTGCPIQIEKLWSSKDIANYKECEKEMHKMLKRYRTSGEWFKYPYEKICLLAQEITREPEEQSLFKENEELKRTIKTLQLEIKTLREALNNDIPIYSNQWGV